MTAPTQEAPDLRYTASPMHAAMVEALTECGLAHMTALGGIITPDGWTDAGVTDWPHPDRAVRDRFHARWTAIVQARCGLDPETPTVAEELPTRPKAAPVPAVPLRGSTLTAPEREAICIRYQNGETGVGLAACFEVSKDLIYRTLDEAGVPRRTKWLRHAEARRAKIAEAVRLYRPGMTMPELGRMLCVGRNVAAGYLRDAGIAIDVTAARSTGGRNRWARVRAGSMGPLEEAA